MTQLICLALVLISADDPNWVKYLERTKDDREAYIRKVESSLSTSRKLLVNARRNRRGVMQAEAQLKDAEKRLAATKEPGFCTLELLPIDSLEAGDIGSMRFGKATVIQVVDDSNVLVNVSWADSRIAFWLTGVKTENVVDGQEAKFGGLFQVVGTKRYGATLGQRTAWEVRPFTPPKP